MPPAESSSARWAPTWEQVATFVIVAVAAALRLAPNDALALNAQESQRAFAGWQLHQGMTPGWWDAPALVAALAGVFFVGTAGDFTARLVSAAAGTTVVALALGYRPYLGRWGALFGGALLALSPIGLLGARTVDEVQPAVAVGLGMGLLLVRNRGDHAGLGKPVLLGAGAALLLNLGAPGVTTLLVLVLFCGLAVSLGPASHPALGTPMLKRWRPLLAALVVGHLLLSTAFLIHPEGLGWSSGAAWARQFEGEGAVVLRWLILAHAEGPSVLIGGVMGVVMLAGAVSRVAVPWGGVQFLAVWGVFGLLLYALSGGPDPAAAGVAATPLALLTARSLASALNDAPGWLRSQALGLIPAMGVLGVFVALTGLELASGGNAPAGNRMAALVLALALLALCALALGAQAGRPWPALALALMLLAVPFVLHGAGRAAQGDLFPVARLINGGTTRTLQEHLVLVPQRPQDGIRTVQVASALRPVLAWQLRTVPGIQFTDDPAVDADLVIVPEHDAARFSGSGRRTINLDLSPPAVEGFPWTPGAFWAWAVTGRLPDRGARTERISVVSRT